MKLYDITRTLSPAIAVWPGDQPFAPSWTARIEDGSSVNIGSISLSTHCGTHADAPLHFLKDGQAIGDLALAAYMGPAWVLDASERDVILPADVRVLDFSRTPRLLMKTRCSAVADTRWSTDFPAVHPDTARFLGGRGVVLIGTDAPSVDPADGKVLSGHEALAENGIAILENLSLHAVDPGRYQLIALPLKLAGMDASPVRAVLTEI